MSFFLLSFTHAHTPQLSICTSVWEKKCSLPVWQCNVFPPIHTHKHCILTVHGDTLSAVVVAVDNDCMASSEEFGPSATPEQQTEKGKYRLSDFENTSNYDTVLTQESSYDCHWKKVCMIIRGSSKEKGSEQEVTFCDLLASECDVRCIIERLRDNKSEQSSTPFQSGEIYPARDAGSVLLIRWVQNHFSFHAEYSLRFYLNSLQDGKLY